MDMVKFKLCILGYVSGLMGPLFSMGGPPFNGTTILNVRRNKVVPRCEVLFLGDQ